MRWSRDRWTDGRREPARLLSPDAQTLVEFGGRRVTAYFADRGAVRWEITVADSGSLLGGVAADDHDTVVLWSDTLAGRVFVIRGGRLVNTLATRAEELAVSADGRLIVVTQGRQLRAFDAAGGLLWTYTGDDALRRPCVDSAGFAPRIAVGSELGALTVLSSTGEILLERDMGALPAPKLLLGGDLLVATWMGRITRLDRAYAPRIRCCTTATGPHRTVPGWSGPRSARSTAAGRTGCTSTSTPSAAGCRWTA
ncbi:PQQ-binding-like beta-propeller repeat protein [Streptomyces sp. NBC_01275]|uniref:outer membrane protein assembly factor BamB family protein n=1 Tax=Streptomyces sp. NBC_01275 TaxID=2903807 RepID=UPI00224E015E|nr:PQQ-binding-like beta-propeller repeat protein [Streptomyces sp. NBC_01275]MCX4759452.1 PQQ-binding-like beta-propeller repeat protein [Streptomyces sp. NBC_01275]